MVIEGRAASVGLLWPTPHSFIQIKGKKMGGGGGVRIYILHGKM
jgi:hypothetical protein